MRRLSLLALLLAAPAFAQPPARPASIAGVAAPFIDQHTLVVVRLDVARVDLDAVFKLAATMLGDDEGVGEIVPTVREWVRQFVKLGGKDIVLTYGPGDFPNPPCVIVPAPADRASREALGLHLLTAYRELGDDADWLDLHGCACVGTKRALAVLKARKPVERPELQEALDAGRNGIIQVAFALSAEAKKIHEQVAPILPPELGGGSIHRLTRGMKWMAITVGPGPKLPATWITEAVSPEAAHDLKGIEARIHQAAVAELLKGAGETDAELRKRVLRLTNSPRTTMNGHRLTAEWDLAPALLEAVKVPEGPPAERLRSANNMKQLMLALHNYHDAYGYFPTDSRDKDGKPLLSWRVHILPYIEQDNLYRQFRLNEPWDSDHNRKLVAQMPKILRSPRQADELKDRTTYLAPLGKGLMWDEPDGLKISRITDGTSNTIALVEADDDRAVVWTKPEDISINSKNPFAGLLGHYTDGFQAAMADGSVRFIRKSVDPMTLWAMFTREGGEVLDLPK